ncbi:MAG: autotransporter outer membrane beta-barrel domain-containing protein, partial [Alphaproteobacteria bacterium]|nr:autotransporter outer membrane beta-barrel domain-containing protein [Alphaproteobacteria bacterium]
MTKHRLMLSAAATALLAAPFATPAHGATTITETRKSAINTTSAGDITINSGGVEIKAASPAVTINSNNFLINQGVISNENTAGAVGILVDTSAGDIVSTSGIANLGNINLTGDGTGKSALLIQGGHTYYAPITLATITTTAGSAASVSGSSVSVVGDGSNIFTLVKGTTIDGDVTLGGSMVARASDKSQSLGNTAIAVEGNLQGNFVIGQLASLTAVGNQARGIAILGPITPCVDNAGVGYTCANSGTATASTGAFANFGTIQVLGTLNPNRKGGNYESGSAVIIGSSVAGGFYNAGPSTSNGTTPSAVISGNGDLFSGSSGSVFAPTVLIDPSQTVTALSPTVAGPAIIGPVGTQIDSVDGGKGYAFINHGTITGVPVDLDVSALAVAIQGSSATNFTCLGVASGGVCDSTAASGGLLNTGTIRAQAQTKEDTTSSIAAAGLYVGAFATVPRIDVAGEFISGTTYTPGTIAAAVVGPGGGIATALQIGDQAVVPQIDVLQHGSIAANVRTSTISPDAINAPAASPFTQTATAILDQSGSVRLINNAGQITAVTTVQTPGANAAVVNNTLAINLLAGTAGQTVINNSGLIEGDVLFNSGGGGNVLNVGNVGDATNPNDNSGNANTAITAVQGAAVANTPFNYATVTGRISGSVSGAPPISETNLINFGSGTGNPLHVGGFGYVNSIIASSSGGLDVHVDNNGQLFLSAPTGGSVNVHDLIVANGGTLGLSMTQTNASSVTPVVLAATNGTTAPNVTLSNANIGLKLGSFISSGSTAESTANPTRQVITLISSQTAIIDTTLAQQNAILSQNIPFLFESQTDTQGNSAGVPDPLSFDAGHNNLLLTLLPRSTGATNADGTPGLNLSGDAKAIFPYAAAALANDPQLGSAIGNSMTVYKTNGIPASGINVAASQQRANEIFSQMTPDVSGGTRQVAIMLTDQATGPVAARQRLLRSYADQPGELTLWSEEFIGNINNKGRNDANGTLTNYKDHGFGFSLGLDFGSARDGWYGGALTYYSGDVSETLPRSSLTHEQWYMLTGYSDWRGKHIFIDSTASVGYGSFVGNRTMVVADQSRDAVGKRAGLVGAAGVTGGVFLKYGFLEFLPHIALDGLAMREEGYTESGGGEGLDLQVAPYYANSLRGSIGGDFKTSFDLFGATIVP